MPVNSGFVNNAISTFLCLTSTSKYTEETAERLATQLLQDADSETRIALISTPSVYVQLKKKLVYTQNSASSRAAV